MRLGPRLLFLGLGLFATSQLIHSAQPEPTEPPRFRVGVDAIRMDVVVTDRDGNLVTDLTAADFEVRQDGKVQAVTLARYVPLDVTAPAALSTR